MLTFSTVMFIMDARQSDLICVTSEINVIDP